MKILNLTQNTLLATQGSIADTFGSRMKGLLGRTHLNPQEALLITQCHSIHMFFMKFSIDAIFIDRNNRVVCVIEGIKPFTLSPIFWNAKCVVEVPKGTIQRSKTTFGDQLEIQEL